MTRFAIVSAAVVCAGLALTAFAHTQEAGTVSEGARSEPVQKELADVLEELERRITRIEQQLAARSEQESLGRGLVAFGPVVANLKEGQFPVQVCRVPGVCSGSSLRRHHRAVVGRGCVSLQRL